jgi:ribonuclease III
MDSTGAGAVLRDALQERLNYRFTRMDLLELALTHRSWKEECGGGDNERLEFLGDAVVELVVTEYLVDRFPDTAEGALSRVRARLVRTTTLAMLGRKWGLGAELRLGRGEAASGGAEKDSLLANAVEAVLGAIYRDAGLPACREVLLPSLEEQLEGVHDPSDFGVDPKSALQELTMAHWKATPKYQVLETDGPAHARRFHVEVNAAKVVTATGWGGSKRDAQRQAATAALQQLRDKIAAKE